MNHIFLPSEKRSFWKVCIKIIFCFWIFDHRKEKWKMNDLSFYQRNVLWLINYRLIYMSTLTLIDSLHFDFDLSLVNNRVKPLNYTHFSSYDFLKTLILFIHKSVWKLCSALFHSGMMLLSYLKDDKQKIIFLMIYYIQYFISKTIYHYYSMNN